METKQSKFKPLFYVKREDGKVVVVAGKAQIMPYEFDNFEEAEKYLVKQPYDVMIYLISTLMYYEKESQNQKDMEQDC